MQRRYLVIAVALVAGVGLSFVSYLFARQWELGRAESAFRALAEGRVSSIREQLDDQMAKVADLRAMYASSSEIAKGDVRDYLPEFHAMVRAAYLGDPRIGTVVFLARVTNGNRERFTQIMRESGERSFQILDRQAGNRIVASPARPLYLPAVAVEPLPESSALQGIDFLQDPRFQAALEQAEKNGMMTATSPLAAGTGPEGRKEIWIFAPLYSDVAASDTLKGVRPMLEGFMGMAFYVDEIVANAFRDTRPAGIDFMFYDTPPTGGPKMFYAYVSRPRAEGKGASLNAIAASEGHAPYAFETTISFAGRTWRVEARPAAGFIQSHTYSLAWGILGVALLSTAVMFLFLVLNLRRSQRVEEIVQERTADLSREVAEHRSAEESLKQAQVDVARWIEAINQRSRELELLGEMGDLLQACRSLDEAYPVVATYAGRLFPAQSGILWVYHDSHQFLEPVAAWGDRKIPEALLQPDSCWGLRRGKLHVTNGARDALVCQHVLQSEDQDGTNLCLPMIAQGEAIGLFHVSWSSGVHPKAPEIDDATVKLVSAVGEHVAMALANLRLRETLRQQSIRDPLTTLFNRRYMEESLVRELHRAKRNDAALGLIIADIDHFKQFNDTFGHEAGDAVLRAVARILTDSTRGEDVPCRFGGEEFILILPGGSLDSCRQKADFLRREVETLQVEAGGKKLPRLTISLGVAAFPACAADSEALLRAADSALYAAKQGGRNRVESAAPLPA